MRWGSAEEQHKDSDCAETHSLCLHDKNGFVFVFSDNDLVEMVFSVMHVIYTVLNKADKFLSGDTNIHNSWVNVEYIIHDRNKS